MTTTHSSTTFQRALRHGSPPVVSCLTLRWSVAPAAMRRPGRRALTLELKLTQNQSPRLTLEGRVIDVPQALREWDGSLRACRVPTSAGAEFFIADASPIAVAIIDPARGVRPLHVSCDLPAALGVKGGRYELIGGELDLG